MALLNTILLPISGSKLSIHIISAIIFTMFLMSITTQNKQKTRLMYWKLFMKTKESKIKK